MTTNHQTTHLRMESGEAAAAFAAAGAAITAFIAGLWKWWGGRKKVDTQAQESLVSGFVALLAEFKSEREQLVKRITELESENQRQDRHISKLERIMIRHRIEIITEDEK